MSRLTKTEYTVSSNKITQHLTLAIVTDLHNADYRAAIPMLRKADAILIVGDLVNRHRKGFSYAASFLREAPKIAPTFYSIGNHEWKFPWRDAYWPMVLESQTTVLDNRFVHFRGITLGGLSSAPKEKLDAAFLTEMEKESGFRLLMCHHPELYPKLVAGHDIDLTVSGHAHGGQIQLLGRGLFAPGQGILPKWTNGFYFDGRLLVSRGMTNSAMAPRLCNPCELILLHLKGSNPYAAKD